MSFFSKILNVGADKPLRSFEALAAEVNQLEPSFEALSDDQLKAKTNEFRSRLASGESLDDLQAEAFATVREAARRVLGQRHFDVQLVAGAALHAGMVAEMKTGEGKTLVSTLPAYLNALAGRGVHMVTVNDYLASRDADWMGAVHRFLGLSVGLISPGQSPEEKRAAYAADITYGTNNEFGFDYLRDNMAHSTAEKVQSGHSFAVVDEVDSILIDEARTPLIISGRMPEDVRWYKDFARLVRKLSPEVHYTVDLQKRQVLTTEEGVAKVEQLLGVANIFDHAAVDFVHHLDVALRAKELFSRDVDYLVDHGEVKIVDSFTGRVLDGRRYSEGLHQAIEAKEGVAIKDEDQTLATITLQNYFRLYDRLAGMTGTAETEAAELAQIYGLQVVVIPTNRPVARLDQPDLVFQTEAGKYAALIADVKERTERAQPVLIGTVSIESSERLSKALSKQGISHEVLNAKHHAREAEIIAQAGRPGAVTVATNMAGRGVDIKLGGSPEGLARSELKRRRLVPGSAEYAAAEAELVASFEAELAPDRDKVLAAGGLYVVGTERHESRRIDNQLRGRSGRQGDPGESRFYLSLEDELMRRFQGEWVSSIMARLRLPEDQPIEANMVSKSIERAQRQVESQNFEIRKEVLKYDEVMNSQRELIYRWRAEILEAASQAREDEVSKGPDSELEDPDAGGGFSLVEDWISEVMDSVVSASLGTDLPHPAWDWEAFADAVSAFFPSTVSAEVFDEARSEDPRSDPVDLVCDLVADEALAFYIDRRASFGDLAAEVERSVVLSVIDNKWRDHLSDMDYLRTGIGLRAMGQRDPLVEYTNEAFNLFTGLLDAIKFDAVRYLFHVELRDPSAGATPRPAPVVSGRAAGQAVGQASNQPASVQKVGRNAPCPCGSGKKFKRCHGAV